MKPIILFRRYHEVEEEFNIASKHLTCYESRVDIQPGDLVIGRYSVLPYYEELEKDVKKLGAKLINTYKQHRYVANMSNWYDDLNDFTPQTWMRPTDVPWDKKGSFVLKGETNSKKFLWKSHMFAKDRNDIMHVYCNLQDDGLIGQQDIFIRKYVPLKTYFIGINGLPITDEYRFFVCFGKILTGAFYWSNAVEDLKEMGIEPNVEDVPKDFLDRLVRVVSPNINFFVMDIAQTVDDKWILIELNDGQMSGLSENNPEALYEKLSTLS